MANKKTTELTATTAAALADGDLFLVVDVSDTTDATTGTPKKLPKSELAEAAGVAAHLADTTDAHDASAISFAPTGTIAGTDVQTAVAEVASEAATALSDHLADGTDAHDASAISLLDTAGYYTATNVEAALAELPSQYFAQSKSVPDNNATATPLFVIAPPTNASFQFSEWSSGPQTDTSYNHWFGFGFNANRHAVNGGATGASVTANKPAWYMGLEDNWYDTADSTIGPEWYISYWSGDGTSVQLFRPLYTRVISTGSNVRAVSYFGIGNDGSGTFNVATTGFNIMFTVAGSGTFATGQYANTNVTLKSNSNTSLFFQDSGGTKWQVGWSGGGGVFQFVDSVNSSRQHMAFTAGSTALTALTQLGSRLRIDGTIAAGASTGAPSIAGTANLGTGAPSPTLTSGSNASRGRIEFGTGTSPAAGGLVTLTFPSGSFASGVTPRVMLTHESFLSTTFPLYVSAISDTAVTIGFGTAPAASQAAGTYKVAYQVLG